MKNLKIDNREKKLYSHKKELQDFLPNPLTFGVVVTKGDNVLFAESYKTFNKANEAYNTIIAAHRIFGVQPDNETTIAIWNGNWFFNEHCFLTDEFIKKCDKLSEKWFNFLFKETESEERKKIKEVHFNKKNYELISRKGCINYLNSYPVIIDNNVTKDFEVIYEEIAE